MALIIGLASALAGAVITDTAKRRRAHPFAGCVFGTCGKPQTRGCIDTSD
jgi:hypothetical protein